MATCGHCKDRAVSVDHVRFCAASEYDPGEVCCFSCDGLIGYGGPWIIDGERAGCGGPGICKRDFPATWPTR